ncbi:MULTISPECIES: glutamate racemase [unclassified Acinetobacter]|uniref:glutamate racemase n=1 Tax=unclassified Acinetobacter TaxID=196816 RepID=UPI0035B77AAD
MSALQLNSHTKTDAPIGIFDSGIGGLSIALEVMQHLPQERILYYADSKNVPYGNKTDQEIRDLTAQALAWLYEKGCKLAIVACNTASAFSLEPLRQHYGDLFPIIGLVPAVKPAVIHSQSKTIAVLATPATFRGKLIRQVIADFAQPAGVTVLPITCADLVPIIERGQIGDPITAQLLQQILQPAIDAGADHLVLGCSHYPFLKPILNNIFPNLVLIDSGQAVSRQCGRVLAQFNLQNNAPSNTKDKIICVFSGDNSDIMRQNIHNFVKNITDWQFINRCDFAKIENLYT